MTQCVALQYDTIYDIIQRRRNDDVYVGQEASGPRGGGSHFKLICEGHVTIVVPVHNGKVKRIYARKIAELLADLAQ